MNQVQEKFTLTELLIVIAMIAITMSNSIRVKKLYFFEIQADLRFTV